MPNLAKALLKNLNSSKPFVFERDRTWTYVDLEQWKRKFIEFVNITKPQRILINITPGFYAYSAILCSYLANITFCIISPSQPIARQRFVAESFAPDLVICEEFCPQFKDVCEHCTFIQPNDIPVSNILPIKDLSVSLPYSELAYILYTSGSSGLPKGVKITRMGLEKLVCWGVIDFGITADDVYGQYAPLHFDMSMFDVFACAAAGAALVPFTTIGERLFPGRQIRRWKISFWNSVPQIFDVLNRAQQMTPNYLSSLRTIKIGGDKVHEDQLTTLFNVMPNLEVILTYGPTETTIFCTYLKVNSQNFTSFSNGIMSIGNAVPGWHVHVDAGLGKIGEIVVSGNYIGAGYLNEPEAGSNFRDTVVGGNKMASYFTGDYAYVERGHLFFKGRRDSQVKINGNRLDLTEIELQALRCRSASAVALIVDSRIVLFYVSSDTDQDELLSCLALNLPSHAVPTVIRRLDVMPLNQNGKPDKIALQREAGSI